MQRETKKPAKKLIIISSTHFTGIEKTEEREKEKEREIGNEVEERAEKVEKKLIMIEHRLVMAYMELKGLVRGNQWKLVLEVAPLLSPLLSPLPHFLPQPYLTSYLNPT